MAIFSDSLDEKIKIALNTYSEYQVARMFGVRISGVRAIKVSMQMDSRRQQDLFREDFKLYGTVTGRTPSHPDQQGLHINPDMYKPRGFETRHVMFQVDADYAGLEARVLAGFFTPTGQPTPAFWGFISQYVKKSGHTMLDILHDQEIYAPEQLQRALDIDSQLEDMSPEQLASLLQRVSKKVYQNAIADPNGTRANVSDGE